jgi:8-oxo-dGTP pyrophosphatase MutT (NUDIX family)
VNPGSDNSMTTKSFSGGFLYSPKKNAVLLHLRDGNTKINPNKWAFFGGLSEGEETPKQTFIREIKEELNIAVKEEEIIPLCDYLNEELQTYRNVFYVESDLELNEMSLGEGAGFDWVSVEGLFDKDMTDKTEKDLRYFLDSKFYPSQSLGT